MNETAPVAGISLGLLILMIGAGAFVFWMGHASAGTARRTSYEPAPPRGTHAQRPIVPALTVVLLLAGGLLFALMFTAKSVHTVQQATIVMDEAHVAPPMVAVRAPEVAVMQRRPAVSATEVTADVEQPAAVATLVTPPESKRPAWTSVPEKTVQAGHIPDVLLVRESKLCTSEAEAVREATALAIATLKRRLVDTYPQMASWQMSEMTFRQHAQKQQFVDQQLHDFKSFEETMYTAYVQFEDSPRVRELLEHDWRLSEVDRRMTQYGLGTALLALGLGFVSSVLRVAGSSGHSRQRAVATAIVLAAAGGAGLLLVG